MRNMLNMTAEEFDKLCRDLEAPEDFDFMTGKVMPSATVFVVPVASSVAVTSQPYPSGGKVCFFPGGHTKN